MRFSIGISKITPPHLPNIVYRSRLLKLLENNQDKQLILVLGQAAQGKSTLVASHVKQSKIPSAWMNLDHDDGDPEKLFHLIVYSLQYALKEINFDDLLLYPVSSGEPGFENPLFRERSQSIFERIMNPIYIVLDGLDQIPSDAPAFEFLRALMENAPPIIHFIIISREIPPQSLEFQGRKMRQEALVLRNEDLAFTQEEIHDFFRETRNNPYPSEQVKKIHLATQGWIGGVILLAESLSRVPEPTREMYISQELPDHFKKEAFQYFGQEIFSSQPQPVQEFLVKSSIIDVIEPNFIKDLIGTENAEEILREHVRKNLFVQSFYEEKRGWVFQYHQQFRAFLKRKFESTVGEEERLALLLKAGQMYEQRGEWESAEKYFLEAEAYAEAASVMERLGMALLKMERKADLLKWVRAFPERVINENPWLLLYSTVTRRLMEGRENVTSLKRAYDLFEEEGDIRGKAVCLAQLISVSLHSGVHLLPMERLIAEGEILLQSRALESAPYEKAMLWSYIGLAHIIGEGDIRRGIQACQNSYTYAKQMGNLSLQGYATAFSALGHIFVGEFAPANEIWHKDEILTEKGGFSELAAIKWMVKSIGASYEGDLIRVQELAEKLKAEAEKLGSAHMELWGHEIMGYFRVSREEFTEAEDIGRQYLNAATTLNNEFFKGLALKLLGLNYFYQGDFEKAREFTDQALDSFSKRAPSTYHLHQAKLMSGVSCLYLKNYKKAEKELREALEYFSSISSSLLLAEAHLALAFLAKELGKNDQASSHLRAGFKIASDRGYAHLYLLGTKYFAKACFLALHLGVAEAVDYATHLLSTRLSPFAEAEIEKLSDHRDSKIREKVQEIKQRIHRSKVPRLRVETFGGFRVYRGSSLIEDKEWDRSQPKQLLKLILSHEGRRIPREALMEQLWPEEKPRSAEANFKTTLQRLRKSLEPDMDKGFGSSYVHVQDNSVLLDQDLWWVDAAQFLSLIKKGEEKEMDGEVKNALSLYSQAKELYKGDFLPDEVYFPQLDRKREEFREKYIHLLQGLADLHEKQGALRKAIDCHKQAIQADPLLEESYQKLMTLYSVRGMYNEALRTYEACKKAVQEELKTKPDPMTTAIYNKILEKIKTM